MNRGHSAHVGVEVGLTVWTDGTLQLMVDRGSGSVFVHRVNLTDRAAQDLIEIFQWRLDDYPEPKDNG